MPFLPFSPRWLVYSDRDEEAITVLAKLRAGGDRTVVAVQKEYTEIKDNVRFEREFATKNYSELIKRGPENIRKRVLLGIFIQIFQQLNGISAIMVNKKRKKSFFFSKNVFNDYLLRYFVVLCTSNL
jgi:hypothetical protein